MNLSAQALEIGPEVKACLFGVVQALVNSRNCLTPQLVLNLGCFGLPKITGFADRPVWISTLLPVAACLSVKCVELGLI